MSSSTDAVRCTVRDGAMWMHLDTASVEIPPKLVNESQILLDALSVTNPSITRKVTLPAPKEWLQAWAACYCNEEEILSCKDVKVLVNCLLVCFLHLDRSSNRADKSHSASPVLLFHSSSSARLNTCSLIDHLLFQSLFCVPRLLSQSLPLASTSKASVTKLVYD
jgi:hypothetical protein